MLRYENVMIMQKIKRYDSMAKWSKASDFTSPSYEQCYPNQLMTCYFSNMTIHKCNYLFLSNIASPRFCNQSRLSNLQLKLQNPH